MRLLPPPLARQIHREPELPVVVQPVMRPAERHDAVRVTAAAVLPWHDVRRIHGRAPADQARERGDLRALRRRRRHQRRPDHPAPSHTADRPRVSILAPSRGVRDPRTDPVWSLRSEQSRRDVPQRGFAFLLLGVSGSGASSAGQPAARSTRKSAEHPKTPANVARSSSQLSAIASATSIGRGETGNPFVSGRSVGTKS